MPVIVRKTHQAHHLRKEFFMNPNYPNLLSPLRVGNVILKNRMICHMIIRLSIEQLSL